MLSNLKYEHQIRVKACRFFHTCRDEKQLKTLINGFIFRVLLIKTVIDKSLGRTTLIHPFKSDDWPHPFEFLQFQLHSAM